MADNQDPKISAQNAKNTQDTAKATANAADKQKLLRDVLEETLFLQRDYSSEVQKLGKNLQLGAIQTAELKKAFKDTANYAKDLTNAVDDVLDGTLDLAELEAKIAKGKVAQTNLDKETFRTLEKIFGENNKIKDLQSLMTEGKLDESKLQGYINDKSKEFTEEQQLLITIYNEQKEALEEQTKEQDKLLERAKNQKEAFGLTGDILKSSTEAMKELGLGSLASAFNFDKAAAAGKKMAAELTNGGEQALSTAGRIKVLQASFSELGKGFVKNITSFEVIAAFALKSAIEASKQTAELQKETGMSYKNAYLLKQEMSGVAIASGDAFVTTEKLMKAAASLTHELGMSAEVLGHEALVSAANLEQKLGFSAKESATLVSNARLQGKNTEEVLDANIKIVGEFNKQNRTALNVSKVLKEAANASMSLQANLGFSNDKLIGAASAATKLGLSLSEVEGVADSLLNFEDSITKELEAELLTGKDLNFEKERQLALAGDLEGLSKSLNNNAAIQDAFASKNVLAQKALAESMGMTRDQLAKITLQQKFNTMAAEDFREMYGEATYESMKQEGAAEKLKNVLNKVLDILGSILGVFSPILDAIAYLASSSIGVATILALVAYKTLPVMVGSFKGILGSIKGMASGLANMFSGANKGADMIASKSGKLFSKDSPQGKMIANLSGDKTKDIADKAGEGAGSAADKTKGVKSNMGKDIKNFLTNLSKGIQSFAPVKASDIVKLAGSALALVTLTPAIPALLLLQLVKGPAIKSALKGIGDGLVAFGEAAKGLTQVAPYILLAEVLIAGFGAALIPLTYALSKLSPLVESFGKAIKSAFEGLATIVTAVADGFVNFLGAITLEKAAALYLLSGALVALAAGFGTFAIAMGAAGIVSFFAGDGVLSQLETLANMATPLQTVATSLSQMAQALFGVGEALNQIDADKLESLNEFAEVSPLAAVGNAIGGAIESLFGGGETKQSSPELAEIRDILNQILKKETNIYMDSTKVGTGFAMGTSKVQ
jgi:hypothetical protein